ncbi:MAG: DUF2298 domain-containing protein [Haloarculaceae archaeon]
MEYGLVAVWLVVYLAVLFAGGAIAAALFPRLDDRGLGVAMPLGLAVVWLVTYFVGRLSMTAGIWLGVAVLVAGAAVAGYRGVTVDRRQYAETAGVFTVAFLLLIAVRAADPALTPLGGEKFLDYGLLKSLLRSSQLPPEDMWFAGEPVAYYYGGHLTAAILTRLTGTASQYAYHLALAGFYGMLVTAAYGLAGDLAATRDVPRRVGAIGGAFFVGIASNLSTPGRFVLWLLPDGTAQSVSSALGLGMKGVAGGPDAFHYWYASRIITDDPSDFAFYEPPSAPTINEFPLFSWLNGDLHAHMTSTPFLLLVVAVLLAYYLTPAAAVRRRRALLFGVVPPVAGVIAVTNTWSFPAVGGVVALTVAFARTDPQTLLPEQAQTLLSGDGPRHELERVGVAIAVAAGVLALGVVWSLPFWLGPASGREIGLLPDRSSLGELLVVHGGFLLVFALYFYGRGCEQIGTDRTRIGALVTVAAVALAAEFDLAALGLFVPLLVVGWLSLRQGELAPAVPSAVSPDGGGPSSDGVGFETVLVLAGAGLVTLVEFVFLQEAVGRMNTVFKVYMQVWVLWSVAAGATLAWIVTRWPSNGVRWRRQGVRVVAALLLVSASLYAGFALTSHLTNDAGIARADDPTLNGTAWLDERHPAEAKAIRWLDRRDGRPTIVTAAPAGYRWNPEKGQGASAPASLTGLPTVAGWYHEAQYRNDTVYQSRVNDVRTIYTGPPDEQRRLLRTYDVRYVYVGPAERNSYDGITVGDLDGVRPVRQWDGVTIYRVESGVGG